MSEIPPPPPPPAAALVGSITVRPWIDPVVDDDGFDPRSRYVEVFWLGVLGPTATWLLRRLVAGRLQMGVCSDESLLSLAGVFMRGAYFGSQRRRNGLAEFMLDME